MSPSAPLKSPIPLPYSHNISPVSASILAKPSLAVMVTTRSLLAPSHEMLFTWDHVDNGWIGGVKPCGPLSLRVEGHRVERVPDGGRPPSTTTTWSPSRRKSPTSRTSQVRAASLPSSSSTKSVWSPTTSATVLYTPSKVTLPIHPGPVALWAWTLNSTPDPSFENAAVVTYTTTSAVVMGGPPRPRGPLRRTPPAKRPGTGPPRATARPAVQAYVLRLPSW